MNCVRLSVRWCLTLFPTSVLRLLEPATKDMYMFEKPAQSLWMVSNCCCVLWRTGSSNFRPMAISAPTPNVSATGNGPLQGNEEVILTFSHSLTICLVACKVASTVTGSLPYMASRFMWLTQHRRRSSFRASGSRFCLVRLWDTHKSHWKSVLKRFPSWAWVCSKWYHPQAAIWNLTHQ